MDRKQSVSPKWRVLNSVNPQETAHLPDTLRPSRKLLYSGESPQTDCQGAKDKDYIFGAGGSSGGHHRSGSLAWLPAAPHVVVGFVHNHLCFTCSSQRKHRWHSGIFPLEKNSSKYSIKVSGNSQTQMCITVYEKQGTSVYRTIKIHN